MKKKIKCICHYCGGDYEAERRSSKYCRKAHRTAAWRARKDAADIFKSLHLYDRREGERLISIRRDLIVILRRTIEYDTAGKVPLALVKALREQLKRTIDSWMKLKKKSLADQIEWIYDYVDGFLYLLIDKNEKEQIQICTFRLGNEVRNGIDKLIGTKNSC